MEEEKCAWCGCQIEENGMCLELWLRVPEEKGIQEALGRASEIVASAFGVKPEVRIHEGYVTPPECFCSFPCLAQYAVARWRQTDVIKGAAGDSSLEGWDSSLEF